MKKKSIIVMSLLALACIGAGIGCKKNNDKQSSPEVNQEEELIVLLNDYETQTDLSTMRMENHLGVITMNKDASYVTSGKTSIKVVKQKNIGMLESSLGAPFIHQVTEIKYKQENYGDLTGYDRIAFDVYNANDSLDMIGVQVAFSYNNVGGSTWFSLAPKSWTTVYFDLDENNVPSGEAYAFNLVFEKLNAEEKTFYIDALRLVKGTSDSETTIVEAKNLGSEFDVKSVIAADKVEQIEKFEKKGNVVYSLTDRKGNVLTSENSRFATSKLDEVYYDITARYEAGSLKTEFYNGGVDFVDFSKGFEWADGQETIFNLERVRNYGAVVGSTVDISTMDFKGEREGNYYKVSKTDDSLTYAIVNNMPTHSREYYEMFRGVGYNFSYELYADVTNAKTQAGDVITDTVTHIGGFTSVSEEEGYSLAPAKIPVKEWKTFTVKLDDLLDNWDAYTSGNSESVCLYTPACIAYGSSTIDGGANKGSVQYDLYVSPFSTAQIISTTEDSQAHTIEVDIGATTYDLKNNLSDFDNLRCENFARFNKVTYTLYDKSENEYVLDGSIVDFGKLEKMYYRAEITVTIGEQTHKLYSGEFDYYNVAEGFAWNYENISSVASKGNTNASFVDLSTEGIVSEKTTKAYKLEKTEANEAATAVLLPVHGKSYYEIYGGMDFEVEYEVYVASTASSVTLKLANAEGFETKSLQSGVWNTFSVSLDALLGSYEEYCAITDGSVYLVQIPADVAATVYVTPMKVKVNVEEIQEIVEEEVRLVDLKECGTSYVLTELLDKKNKFLFIEYGKLGKIEWTLTDSFGNASKMAGTVDFAALPEVLYKVEATLTVGEEKVALYRGDIDFYRSDVLFNWTDSSIDSIDGLDCEGEVVTSAQGKTGVFSKITTANKSGAIAKLLPVHSRAYYEQQRGIGYTISYQIFIEAEGVDEVGLFLMRTENGTLVTTETKVRVGQWNTYYIDLDSLLDIWADYTSDNADTFFFKTGSFYANGTAVQGTELIVYVGEFLPSAELISVTDQAFHLVDVKGMDSYDVLSTVEDGNQEILRGYQSNPTFNWVLTTNFGKVYTSKTSALDFTVIPKMYYTVTGEMIANGLPTVVYTGIFDFYDSEEGFVWDIQGVDSSYAGQYTGNNSDSAVYYNAYVDIAETAFAQGRTGKYYAFNKLGNTLAEPVFAIMPVHSKSYYKLFAGKGIKMQYDMYLELLGVYTETGVNETENCWGVMSVMINDAGGKYNRGNTQVTKGIWKTYVIDFDSFFESYYDAYVDPESTLVKLYRNANVYYRTGSSFVQYGEYKCYFSNFYI